ncbi:hypothetical protein K438DRAFT_1801953 [Mycena galopus ATCC 62051]|nr:hypothetical protein K438DRAFT_1801953 [Mycena galopus ATCC 62051]
MSNASLLLEFPNELLLLIAEDLVGVDDLVHLAMTCRQMNLLLIPVIFTRFRCDPPSSSGELQSLCFTGGNLRLLRALGIAIGVSSVNVMACAVMYEVREFRVKEILDTVAALNSLARRLPHLGHVEFCPIYVPRALKRKLSRYPHAMAAFFNNVARRGDCGLTVYSPWIDHDTSDPLPFVHVHTFPEAGWKFSLRKSLRKLVSWITFSRIAAFPPALAPAQMPVTPVVKSTECLGAKGIPFVSNSALRTLSIHSSFLLHANLYRWTLHLLNTSPLTSLSLDDIDLVPFDWALTLPALTIPMLASLTIGYRRIAIAVPDLHLFLARHPSIHTLDLSFYIGVGDFSPSATTCVLPRLKIIRARPEYLLYFFSAGAEPDVDPQGWYPNLWHVVVTSDDLSSRGVIQFSQVVACIETRPVVLQMELVGQLANHCQVPPNLTLVPEYIQTAQAV